jgi:Immunoglobulin-like domain of bacterial spore germination
MKIILYMVFIIAVSCNDHTAHKQHANDTAVVKNNVETAVYGPDAEAMKKEKTAPPPPETFSNTRFKEVTAERKGEHQFLIKGKAQVFEANVSWVVEDGHNELKKGFVTTDAGAPAWGNFSFTIDIAKQRPNSTLTLILFESSAMDGSRQHELPVVLY